MSGNPFVLPADTLMFPPPVAPWLELVLRLGRAECRRDGVVFPEHVLTAFAAVEVVAGRQKPVAPPERPQRWLGTAEACQVVGVSAERLRRAGREGRVTSEKIAGRRLYVAAEVEAWAQERNRAERVRNRGGTS